MPLVLSAKYAAEITLCYPLRCLRRPLPGGRSSSSPSPLTIGDFIDFNAVHLILPFFEFTTQFGRHNGAINQVPWAHCCFVSWFTLSSDYPASVCSQPA